MNRIIRNNDAVDVGLLENFKSMESNEVFFYFAAINQVSDVK